MEVACGQQNTAAINPAVRAKCAVTVIYSHGTLEVSRMVDSDIDLIPECGDGDSEFMVAGTSKDVEVEVQ